MNKNGIRTGQNLPPWTAKKTLSLDLRSAQQVCAPWLFRLWSSKVFCCIYKCSISFLMFSLMGIYIEMATVGNDRDSACLFLLTFRTKGCQRCFGTRYNYIAGADTYGTACDMDSEVRQVAKRSSHWAAQDPAFSYGVQQRVIDWPWSSLINAFLFCAGAWQEDPWLDSCRLRTLKIMWLLGFAHDQGMACAQRIYLKRLWW